MLVLFHLCLQACVVSLLCFFSKSVMRSGVGPTREGRVFGHFFVDVPGCLNTMRRTKAVACGEAVLYGLLEFPTWEPSLLVLFVDSKFLDAGGLLPWFRYLKREGYRAMHRFGRLTGQLAEFSNYLGRVSLHCVFVVFLLIFLEFGI